MSSRLCVMLLSAAALAGCGGTTMRVAQDGGGGDGAVSLAPAPEEASDSALPDTSTATSSEAELPQPGQGYHDYGTSTTLELRRIGQWTRTGINESRRLVIRDANAWANFWSELGVGARPSVDFTRDLVLAVAAGQRPSGGYEIAIDGVHMKDGELAVEVLETAPGPDCTTSASLTQPADVVVVPAVSARSWSFVERKEVRGCSQSR